MVALASQSQLDQRSSKRVYNQLLTSLDDIASAYALHVEIVPVSVEKNGEALRARHGCVAQRSLQIFGGVIAQPHQAHGSLHVVLHPADIAMVIESGWGERHVLANESGWWKGWFFAIEEKPPVPENMCFIYAPRNQYDAGIIAKIVKAGVKFVTGVERRSR